MRSAKTFRSVVISSVILCAGSGCSLLSPRDRPLDINADMPKVSVVIASVQAAIDATHGASWRPTAAAIEADKQCGDQVKAARLVCAAAYVAGRENCRRETGPTAAALCTDFLRDAATKCSSGKPDVCELAASYAPLNIKSATFSFSAVSSSNADAGIELKLISGKAARKAGRASSFVIEMIPREPIFMRAPPPLTPERKDLSENLIEALQVALEAANHCSTVGTETTGLPVACHKLGTPQLALNKATYTVEIDYAKSSSVGFEWTVAPVKISAGGGSEQKLGNTLVVELGR